MEHTLVLGIMERAIEHLERASDIQGVVLGEQSKEHLDDLNRAVGVVRNCTHLARFELE
jgi:hypothetical protein